MTAITNATASANILAACEAKTLLQKSWHTRHEGREMACLLGSIDPSVKSAQDCNGDLMPLWMAELTVTLFDGIPASEIIPIARRYGRLVGRWHVLTTAAWDKILVKVLIKAIDDSLDYSRPVASDGEYWPAVESACKQVKLALESGDKEQLSAAGSAARSAAGSAARSAGSAAWSAESAASAARSAESAAWSPAESAASAAWSAESAASAARSAESAAWSPARSAESAARSAAWSAESAARSAAWSAESAAWSAESAAYLKSFTFLLDQVEASVITVDGK